MSSFGEKALQTLQSIVGITPASPTRQINDAASPTRTAPPTHPPSESRRTSTSESTVDRPSPARSEKRSELPTAAERARPSKKQRYNYSSDEERLVPGRYRTPTDATPLPNPESWLLGWKENSRNMVKPGAAHSLRPIDTINREINGGLSASQPTTYGKRPTSHKLKFLDKQQIDHPGANGHHTISTSLEPAAKKRKIEPSSVATPQVMVDQGDDVWEVSPPPPSRTQHSPSTRPPATTSSRRSIGSGHRPSFGPRPTARSEFASTDLLGDAHRKRARTLGRGSLHSHPIELDAEPKKSKFDGFKQGIPTVSSSVVQPDFSETTSGHFANSKAKMNHSTYPPRGEPSEDQRAPDRRSTNVRNSFRKLDIDSISDDELAGPTPQLKKRPMSPAKHASEVRPAPSYRKIANMPSDGWPLGYARAHGYEDHGPGLSLRSGAENSFRIAKQDNAGVVTRYYIPLTKVNQAETDSETRIRLKGPQDADGVQFIVDLEFAKQKDLLFFQTEVRRSITQSKMHGRVQNHMAIIFSKPLAMSSKINIPFTSVPPTESTGTLATKRGGTKMIDSLKGLESSQLRATKPTRAVASTPNPGPRHSDRPTRSTRATKLDYCEAEPEIFEAPERYSVLHGLGPRWKAQLQFNAGRRRANVDFLDLERLDDGEFLNDQLIDFYLLYLFKQMNVPEDKVYIFNTHFFSTLTRRVPGQKGSINYSAVARWTSKDDLFGYDYIVVPINQDAHWYLALICNAPNIARTPAIEDTESLAKPDPETVGAPENRFAPTEAEPSEAREVTPPPPAFAKLEIPTTEPVQDDGLTHSDQEESSLDLVGTLPARREPDRDTATDDMSGTYPAAETARLKELTLSDPTPKGILPKTSSSPTPKRAKRKSGPPPRAWKTDEPTIIILDSLGGGPRSQAVRALKDYIREEGRDKRGMDAVITQNAFYAKSDQIPLQENFSDCGVYLLGYTQKFFEDPDRFKNRLLSGQMRTETDWPDMPMPQMRGLMRDILQGLYKYQEETSKKEKAEKRAKKTTPAPKATEKSSENGIANTRASPPKDETFKEAKADVSQASVEAELGNNENSLRITVLPIAAPAALASPSTPRLGSPFEPTPTKLPSFPQSPVEENLVMKVDNSPTPPRITSKDFDRIGSGDDRFELPNFSPVRKRSPQVIIPSPKRRAQVINSQPNAPSDAIVAQSSSKSRTRSHSPLKSRSPKAISKGSPLQRNGTVLTPSKIRQLTEVPLEAARDSPARSPVRHACGSSQNPIPLEDSQDTIHDMRPTTPKVQPSPDVRHTRPISHGENDGRTPGSPKRAATPGSGGRFVGDALDAKLRGAEEEEASRSRIDEEGFEIITPDSRSPVHDDATVAETPSPKRQSPGPQWTESQPLPL